MTTIRCVTMECLPTLLRLKKSISDVYLATLHRFGSTATKAELKSAYANAFNSTNEQFPNFHGIVDNNYSRYVDDTIPSCDGMNSFIDFSVVAADVGWAKPDNRIFQEAHSRASCAARLLGLSPFAASQIVHIGNRVRKDVEGARAAGFRALLIDRDGTHEAELSVDGLDSAWAQIAQQI